MPWSHCEFVHDQLNMTGIREATQILREKEASKRGLIFLGRGRNEYYGLYKFKKCRHIKQIQPQHVRVGAFECKVCKEPELKREASKKGLTLRRRAKREGYWIFKIKKCGHLKELQPVHVRRNKNISCKTCYLSKLKNEARANPKGLVFLGFNTDTEQYLYRFTKCRHERYLSPPDVRHPKGVRCTHCFDEKLSREAERRNLTLIGDCEARGSRRYQFNECRHRQSIRTGAVRSGKGYECSACREEKLIEEACEVGLVLIGKYEPDPRYREYRFEGCEHGQVISTGNVRSNNFQCNICNETARDQPSFVYLVRISIQKRSWLKLGYAKSPKDRNRRYGLPEPYEITPLVRVPIETGRDARQVEQKIHQKFDGKRLSVEQMKRYHRLNGSTECYPMTMENALRNELQKVLA
jgi:hypothetical protein